MKFLSTSTQARYWFHLSRSNFDVEVIPLVGDLEDFGPSEPVDAQTVAVDEEARGTHSQHDLHPLRILGNDLINEPGLLVYRGKKTAIT